MCNNGQQCAMVNNGELQLEVYNPSKGTIVGLHRQSIVGLLPCQESQFTSNEVSDCLSLSYSSYLPQAHDWKEEGKVGIEIFTRLIIFSPQITNVAQQGEIERVKDVLLQVANIFFFTQNVGIFMKRFENKILC